MAIICTQCRGRCCFCAAPPPPRNVFGLCLACGQTAGGSDCAACQTAALIRSSQKAAQQLLHSIAGTQISTFPPTSFFFFFFKPCYTFRHGGVLAFNARGRFAGFLFGYTNCLSCSQTPVLLRDMLFKCHQ